MIKKICPICDHAIGAANYCKVCHQIVWHPERRDIRYYLNESHPAREESCEYHQDFDYGQASYGSGGENKRSGGAGTRSYPTDTGSSSVGKMTKADYLAKKAALSAQNVARTASETAKRVNASVISSVNDSQRADSWKGQETWSGQEKQSSQEKWGGQQKWSGQEKWGGQRHWDDQGSIAGQGKWSSQERQNQERKKQERQKQEQEWQRRDRQKQEEQNQMQVTRQYGRNGNRTFDTMGKTGSKQKKNNLGIQFLVILLIYLLFGIIGSFSR